MYTTSNYFWTHPFLLLLSRPLSSTTQMLPEASKRATLHQYLRAVLVHFVLWLCSGTQRSLCITKPSISLRPASSLSSPKSDWPRTWGEKEICRLCDCDYPARSVSCNDRDFSDGLPAAEDFPWEDLVLL